MKDARPAIVALGCALAVLPALAQQDESRPRQKKPSISLRANPSVAFSPARVVFSADVKGGSDDYEEFYCATVTWEWGDGTESENATDCEPYEQGASKIQRHFSAEHRYETAGEFHVAFRLKRQGKVVGASTTVVRVRPGLRDIGLMFSSPSSVPSA